MRARLVGGWLVVGPYAGHDMQQVRIRATGERGGWVVDSPAFLDWDNGERVAKIRPHGSQRGVATVTLLVGGLETEVGRVVL